MTNKQIEKAKEKFKDYEKLVEETTELNSQINKGITINEDDFKEFASIMEKLKSNGFDTDNIRNEDFGKLVAKYLGKIWKLNIHEYFTFDFWKDDITEQYKKDYPNRKQNLHISKKGFYELSRYNERRTCVGYWELPKTLSVIDVRKNILAKTDEKDKENVKVILDFVKMVNEFGDKEKTEQKFKLNKTISVFKKDYNEDLNCSEKKIVKIIFTDNKFKIYNKNDDDYPLISFDYNEFDEGFKDFRIQARCYLLQLKDELTEYSKEFLVKAIEGNKKLNELEKKKNKVLEPFIVADCL